MISFLDLFQLETSEHRYPRSPKIPNYHRFSCLTSKQLENVLHVAEKSTGKHYDAAFHHGVIFSRSTILQAFSAKFLYSTSRVFSSIPHMRVLTRTMSTKPKQRRSNTVKTTEGNEGNTREYSTARCSNNKAGRIKQP